jgi:hypothetical protein
MASNFDQIETRAKLQSLVHGRVILGGVRDNPFDICYPDHDQRERRVENDNARLKAAGYRTRIFRGHRGIAVLAVA